MHFEQRERMNWLCQAIQVERDHNVLMQLVRELNDLLEHNDGHSNFGPQSPATGGETRVDRDPYVEFGGSAWIREMLWSMIDATAADFGNVQLFNSSTRALRIVAQHGFDRDFLAYFDVVSSDEGCACGAALKHGSRVVVSDVASDPMFANGAREVLLRANVRSIQSTPLIDLSGRLVGMVSTHSRQPGELLPEVCERVDALATSFLASAEPLQNR